MSPPDEQSTNSQQAEAGPLSTSAANAPAGPPKHLLDISEASKDKTSPLHADNQEEKQDSWTEASAKSEIDETITGVSSFQPEVKRVVASEPPINYRKDDASITRSNATEEQDLHEVATPRSRMHAQDVVVDADQSPPPPPPPKNENLQGTTTLPTLSLHVDVKGKGSTSFTQQQTFSSPGLEDGHDEDLEAAGDDSRSEIQSIMGQFDEGMGGPGVTEIMSPRMDLAGPLLASPVPHPPRKSSLEPLQTQNLEQFVEKPTFESPSLHSPPPRTSSLGASSPYPTEKRRSIASITSPKSQSHSIFKPPPLEPDPEPDLPFDFHRFLEQLRHKTADPVARFLRSFLAEFGKKQWMVHEQVKIVGDFLEFISRKMAQCDIWRTVSDAEFDNAKEGMEKLVMNRLYMQTFSPEIPAADNVSSESRRSRAPPSLDMPGRRGQHQEDVERDEVLAQKVRIYKWVKEGHLDIAPVGDQGRKFLTLAQQELSKIRSYRAPRDKVICILNCCKVIFGFLRNQHTDQSADSFVPLLIYTVLQANPEHLVSNVQYILRFRNQDKLGGEAGYYISSLMGAVQFIESLDRTSLTITDEEFEKNVEAAVSAIAERHDDERLNAKDHPAEGSGQQRRTSPHMPVAEKSTLSRAEVTARNSLDAERATPRRTGSGSARAVQKQGPVSTDPEDDAVTGLLKTIQKPLSTIGRIFSDDNTSSSSHPALTPRMSPAAQQRQVSTENRPHTPQQSPAAHVQRVKQLSAADAAARQASAEAEEARKLQAQEHRVVVETLAGMFPSLDREVIDDVVRMKQGRVGLAVDACLALTDTS